MCVCVCQRRVKSHHSKICITRPNCIAFVCCCFFFFPPIAAPAALRVSTVDLESGVERGLKKKDMYQLIAAKVPFSLFDPSPDLRREKKFRFFRVYRLVRETRVYGVTTCVGCTSLSVPSSKKKEWQSGYTWRYIVIGVDGWRKREKVPR